MNTTYTSNPNVVTTKAESMGGTTLNLLSYDLAHTVGAYLTIQLDAESERWILTLNSKSNRELSRVHINYDGVMGDALVSLTLNYSEKIIRATTLKGNIIDCDISELINTLETEINDEMLRAISAEEELAASISDEEARALAAETLLQENIDILNTKVDNEVLRLDGRIDDEASAREAADIAEQEARIEAVANEADARENADSILDSKISDEVAARIDAVATEAELRSTADEALDAAKQNVLTAGNNISIVNDTISAVDTTYTAGNGLSLSGTEFSIDETIAATKEDLTNYSLIVDAGHSLEVSIDSSYVVSLSLKNANGTILGTTQTIDLPLESVVVDGRYDAENKTLILVLDNGNEIDIPVADLINGLQAEITEDNKLSADLVDDTSTTNKFVSVEEKAEWSGKQDELVSGTNIKTVNGESLLGSGNVEISTNKPFPSDWNSYTHGTTKAFCDYVNADARAVQGMSYLGDVYFSDLPFSGNGDAVVEITHGTGTSGKVIHIILSSTNVAPYHWEYGYWGGHSAKGWVGYQPELVAGNNVTLTETTEYDSNNQPVKTKVTIDSADTVYTAGTNVQINNNVISATDTTYSAGDNIDITSNEISVDSGNATLGQILTADGNGSATWETLETTTDYNDLENVPIENVGISTQYETGKYYKEEDSTILKSFYDSQVLSVPTDRIYADTAKENSLYALLPTLTYSEFDVGLDLYLSPLIMFTGDAGLFAMRYNTTDPIYMVVALTDGFKVVYATAAGSISIESQSLSWSQGFNNLDSNNSTAWTIDETISGSFTIANVINVGNWNGNILGSGNELLSGKISRYLDNELKSVLDESNFEDYTKIDLGTFILDTTSITGNNPFVGFSADATISNEDFDKAVNNSQVIAKGQIILTHQQAGIIGTYDICMPKAQAITIPTQGQYSYTVAFITPILGEIENAIQFAFTVDNIRSSGEKHGVFETIQVKAVTSVKTIDTTSTSSLTTESDEEIEGNGTIQLHKISKTGDYDDLNNTVITRQSEVDALFAFNVGDTFTRNDKINLAQDEASLLEYLESLDYSSESSNSTAVILTMTGTKSGESTANKLFSIRTVRSSEYDSETGEYNYEYGYILCYNDLNGSYNKNILYASYSDTIYDPFYCGFNEGFNTNYIDTTTGNINLSSIGYFYNTDDILTLNTLESSSQIDWNGTLISVLGKAFVPSPNTDAYYLRNGIIYKYSDNRYKKVLVNDGITPDDTAIAVFADSAATGEGAVSFAYSIYPTKNSVWSYMYLNGSDTTYYEEEQASILYNATVGDYILYQNKYAKITSITTSSGSYYTRYTITVDKTLGTLSSAQAKLMRSAAGNYAFSEGFFTGAFGNYSHAEGNSSIAKGTSSHAEGSGNIANGNCSHAEGYNTTAGGNYSHTEGYQTNIAGAYSHAEGSETVINGSCSHTEGNRTMTLEDYAHAEGDTAFALGSASHAEGSIGDTFIIKTTSRSENYHEFIVDTSRVFSVNDEFIVPGFTTTEILPYPQTSTRIVCPVFRVFDIRDATTIAITGADGYGYTGYSNYVDRLVSKYGTSSKSITCAFVQAASGTAAHVEGYMNSAKGAYSHVEGKGNIAKYGSQHVFGEYADPNAQPSVSQLTFDMTLTVENNNDYRLILKNSTGIEKYSFYITIAKSSYQDKFYTYKLPETVIVKPTDTLEFNWTYYPNFKTTIQDLVTATADDQVYSPYSSIKVKNVVYGQPETHGKYIEAVGNGSRGNLSNARTLDWEGNEVLSGSLTAKNVIADSFSATNGTSSQFLKADGSVDSTSYATISTLDDYAKVTDIPPITTSYYWAVDYLPRSNEQAARWATIDDRYLWDSDGILYYSNGTTQYYYDSKLKQWKNKTWNGSFTAINGQYVWKDADGNIFYSQNINTSYELNKSTNTWIAKTWDLAAITSGNWSNFFSSIWVYNGETYQAHSGFNSTAYKLNKSTLQWEACYSDFLYYRSGSNNYPIDCSEIWADTECNYYRGDYSRLNGSSWQSVTWTGLPNTNRWSYNRYYPNPRAMDQYHWDFNGKHYLVFNSVAYEKVIGSYAWRTVDWKGGQPFYYKMFKLLDDPFTIYSTTPINSDAVRFTTLSANTPSKLSDLHNNLQDYNKYDNLTNSPIININLNADNTLVANTYYRHVAQSNLIPFSTTSTQLGSLSKIYFDISNTTLVDEFLTTKLNENTTYITLLVTNGYTASPYANTQVQLSAQYKEIDGIFYRILYFWNTSAQTETIVYSPEAIPSQGIVAGWNNLNADNSYSVPFASGWDEVTAHADSTYYEPKTLNGIVFGKGIASNPYINGAIYYYDGSTLKKVLTDLDVKASDINSESATSGQVLTADGLGGASWQNASGGSLYEHIIRFEFSGTFSSITYDSSIVFSIIDNQVITDGTMNASDLKTYLYNKYGQYGLIPINCSYVNSAKSYFFIADGLETYSNTQLRIRQCYCTINDMSTMNVKSYYDITPSNISVKSIQIS